MVKLQGMLINDENGGGSVKGKAEDGKVREVRVKSKGEGDKGARELTRDLFLGQLVVRVLGQLYKVEKLLHRFSISELSFILRAWIAEGGSGTRRRKERRRKERRRIVMNTVVLAVCRITLFSLFKALQS